ncbi:hypothetical protein ABFV05_020423 [Capra hircus]
MKFTMVYPMVEEQRACAGPAAGGGVEPPPRLWFQWSFKDAEMETSQAALGSRAAPDKAAAAAAVAVVVAAAAVAVVAAAMPSFWCCWTRWVET